MRRESTVERRREKIEPESKLQQKEEAVADTVVKKTLQERIAERRVEEEDACKQKLQAISSYIENQETEEEEAKENKEDLKRQNEGET